MSPAPGERLNRFLARRGVASRRHADELIAAGRVSVNAAPAWLGEVVDPERDLVTFDGRRITGPAKPAVTLALNKPRGVVTTNRDSQHRPTVAGLVEPVPGLVPIGRLDADSRGLLLLTTDGELAHRVAHPRFGIHKRYRVTVSVPPRLEQLRRLTAGVRLDGRPARAVEARRGSRPETLEVVMAEGRNREVRRLCAAAGLTVIDLVRLSVGPIGLGGLAEGRVRRLTDAEDTALRQAVGLLAAV